MPDLELHRAALKGDGNGAESSGSEDEAGLPEEETPHIGWSGDWTRRFIWRARAGKDLVPLEKVVWDNAGVSPPPPAVLGVKVRLEPIPGSVAVNRIVYAGGSELEGEEAPEEDANPMSEAYGGLRKQRLESYRIQASIFQVYVTPEFFKEPDTGDNTSDTQATDSDA